MSNYNNLKTSIDANIKQNGNQEITGPILNSVLNQMVTTLGAGYQFAGVATIATDPGTPDAKVFYIANGKGTYEKFGGINVTEDDVVVLYWDTTWHKVSTGIASQEKLSELEGEVIAISGRELRLQGDGAYGLKPMPIVIQKDFEIICNRSMILYAEDKQTRFDITRANERCVVPFDLYYINYAGLTAEFVITIVSQIDDIKGLVNNSINDIALVRDVALTNGLSIEAAYPFEAIAPTQIVADKYIDRDHMEHDGTGYKYSKYECNGLSQIRVSSNVSGSAVAFCTFFDKDDNYIGDYLHGTSYYSNEIVDVPIGAAYVLVSGTSAKNSTNSITLCEIKKKNLIGIDSTSFFKRETKNLFDVNDITNVVGSFWSGYGTIDTGANYAHSHLIRLHKDKSYIYTYVGAYGSNAKYLYCFDINGNPCGRLTGTASADNKYIIIAPLDKDIFVSVNYAVSNQNMFMFVEGDVYPNIYIPHYEHVTIPSIERNSVLTGRSLITYGDSIMNASAAGEKGGWGDLISARNNMSYINRAVGGRRLRREKGKLSILDDMIPSAEIQNYDYIIFQGGVNDGGVNGTWQPPTEGASSYLPFEGLDTSTTYGAFEYLCKWCMINLPTKKFGFIVTYLGCGSSWNEVANNLVGICKKYGMPYLDLRECAGFNLYDEEIRAVYGADTEVADYSESASYSIDSKVRYNGILYKSNFNIPAPAGAFDESKWTNIGAGDSWHCNALAYEKSSHAIEAWLKTL